MERRDRIVRPCPIILEETRKLAEKIPEYRRHYGEELSLRIPAAEPPDPDKLST